MKSRLFLSNWLCASALAAGACVSLSDLPRSDGDAEAAATDDTPQIREDPDDGAPVRDADLDEPDAGETEERDAAELAEPDASPSKQPKDQDSSLPIDAGPDSGDVVVIIEPPVEPTVKSCLKSADCAANEACDGARCIARCTSYGACVAYEAERPINALYTVDDVLYWVFGSTTDVLGNPRKDAELWRKAPNEAPVRIVTGLLTASELVFRNGYVYYRQGASLYRAPLQADATAQHLYNLPELDWGLWAIGDSFIAFGAAHSIEVGSLDGSAALRSIPVDLDANLFGVPLAASGDIVYFQRARNGKISSVRIADPFVIEGTMASLNIGPTSVVRGTTIFSLCTLGPAAGILCGQDLNDGTVFTAATVPDTIYEIRTGASLPEFISGPWAYWGAMFTDAHDSQYSELNRYSLLSVGTTQPVIKPGTKDSVMPTDGPMAASSSKLFFTPKYGSSLLYELPLPPDPCASDLPCPTGKTCGSDKLCH